MRGDGDFDAAFDRLLGRSYRHAVRLVGDRGLAEDLAAEALTRTYAHWSRVRSYEHLDAWVLRVVTNLAIDALAKPRPRPLEPADISAEDAAILRVTLAIRGGVMEDELPPELRSRRHAIFAQVKRRGRARRYRRLGTVSFAVALVLSVPLVAVALTSNGGGHSERISTFGPSTTEDVGTTAEAPTTSTSVEPTTTAPTTTAPTSTQAAETTTTMLVCRNSSNPACGPLSYDPPITNMAASLAATTEPAAPIAGHTVTFTLHVTDPDSLISSGLFCGQASFGEGDSTGCAVACAPLAPEYGKWDPPAPTPGDATFTLTHTYPSAGTFTARFSLIVGECSPRPSPVSASITVHIGP